MALEVVGGEGGRTTGTQDRYGASDTRDALLMKAAELTCIAAGSCVQVLGLPRRGTWILAMLERIAPKCADRFYQKELAAWAAALIAVGGKFAADAVAAGVEASRERDLREHLVTWGAAAYEDYVPMRKYRLNQWRGMVAAKLAHHEESPARSESERVALVLDAIGGVDGRNVPAVPALISKLLESCVITRPSEFARAWKRTEPSM